MSSQLTWLAMSRPWATRRCPSSRTRAPQIRAALAAVDTALVDCATLEAAVQYAADNARAGDIVLLSPACASFDMFTGYGHRASVFIDAVREVAFSRGEVA